MEAVILLFLLFWNNSYCSLEPQFLLFSIFRFSIVLSHCSPFLESGICNSRNLYKLPHFSLQRRNPPVYRTPSQRGIPSYFLPQSLVKLFCCLVTICTHRSVVDTQVNRSLLNFIYNCQSCLVQSLLTCIKRSLVPQS